MGYVAKDGWADGLLGSVAVGTTNGFGSAVSQSAADPTQTPGGTLRSRNTIALQHPASPARAHGFRVKRDD